MSMNWLVGYLAGLFSIFLFWSGSQICQKIYKKGLVGEISAMPFIITLLTSFVSTIYGIIIQDASIAFSNAVGVILGIFYLGFYFYFSTNKKKVVQKFIGIIFVMVLIFYFVFVAYDKEKQNARDLIGYLVCIFSIVMYGSPLASINKVLTSGSTESLSFFQSSANFISASSWCFYGTLLADYFLVVPNAIGAFLGITQVALFIKFPDNRKTNSLILESL